MMKIVTVVGARPQFIKAAAVSRKLRKKHQEILVHTGQHYDANMSEIFFKELDIPVPDYNLGISGGSHGEMTGRMLIEIERVLLKELPDALLIYGDTNSTLAAAIAAVKLKIPVCHLEAGNRLGTLDNPEEVNRICADRVSTILMCCVESAAEFLKKEGITKGVFLTGDPMFDAFLFYQGKAAKLELDLTDAEGKKVTVPEEFYYLTCHREENSSPETLEEILYAASRLDAPTIYPVHPRNKDKVSEIRAARKFGDLILTQPVGYLTSLALIARAKKIITDSGGLQREAFFAEKQCVFIFDRVAWPETMVGNRNQLAERNAEDILLKLSKPQKVDKNYKPFGDGNSAEKIIAAIGTLGEVK
jgi:UDP-N-acetylglucosamine 2-epimerase (non-hydrolysing)/UDP-GlcNAc3NAcA epimerase